MTRIDFYELKSQQHNHDRGGCQLCQKAYENSQYTLLLTQSPEQTAHLDRQLWTFTDDSFIPHDSQESADCKAPILIQNQSKPNLRIILPQKRSVKAKVRCV